MDEPNYSNYTLEELKEAYSSINKKKFPDRAAMLKEMIENPAANGFSDDEIIEEKQSERKEIKTAHLMFGLLTWVYGFYVLLTGNLYRSRTFIEIESIEMRALAFMVIFFVGYKIYERAFDENEN